MIGSARKPLRASRNPAQGVALAFALLLLAVLPAEAADCALRFAWWPWEPYHYLDEDGRMRGIDHALVTEAARRAGCSVTWEQVPRRRSLVLVQEGLIDAVAGLGVTAERQAMGRFSRPLRSGLNVLLVRKGEADRFPATRLADLAGQGFRLGVIAGARHSEEIDRFVGTRGWPGGSWASPTARAP
ncbi:substrate-binding periplasmic protein [Aerophototrophica crusticola]|uniref:substrate-binding periplasmic protein n=1 Tax=Aerophototrophica crusticola TaxID=1709002 RepID=UPI00384EE216